MCQEQAWISTVMLQVAEATQSLVILDQVFPWPASCQCWPAWNIAPCSL